MKGRLRLAVPHCRSAQPLLDRLMESATAGSPIDITFDTVDGCTARLRDDGVDLALLPTYVYRSLVLDQGLDVRFLPGLAVVVTGALDDDQIGEHSLGKVRVDGASTIDAWRRRTGLPFVSMLWMGKAGAADEGVWARLGGPPQSPWSTAASAGLAYRLGSLELSGLAAFLEHQREAEDSAEQVRARMFDFAYTREDPRPVLWPAPTRQAGAESTDALLTDAAAGKRLTPEAALRLHEEASLLDLGRAADLRRQALHPEGIVTYIIDRNINYTNLCVTACKFCNFYRTPKSRDAYTLSRDVLAQKLAETVELGGVQVLLQGGVNPDLRLSYYEDLFRWAKASFPLALHALSPEEVSTIASFEHLSIREVLERLVRAGLDSLPGGGAEILDDEVRHRISPKKCSVDTWMTVMREAHALGLRTTGTMVFGFGENAGHIVRHLERLRSLQDKTAGFTAFICWPFQAEGTRLRLNDDTTAQRYLRTFSLARLYLDNFPHLQVSWPTMGPTIGQVGLRFGGNDFGSAMIEENVVSQAGAVFKLSAADIESRVRAAGFIPRQRSMRYELLPLAQPVHPDAVPTLAA